MKREKRLQVRGLLGHRGIGDWPEIGLNSSRSIGCAAALTVLPISYKIVVTNR